LIDQVIAFVPTGLTSRRPYPELPWPLLPPDFKITRVRKPDGYVVTIGEIRPSAPVLGPPTVLLPQCHLAGGIDVAATLPGDPDPAGHTRAKYLQEMDYRIVRTWRSGFPERHVRTNSIKAREADIYLEITRRSAGTRIPEQAKRHWLLPGRQEVRVPAAATRLRASR
jgi:hypothetical protein